MKLLGRVTLWRAVSLLLFALILAVTFLQPGATDADIRTQAPRIAFSAALFLTAVAVVPILLRPTPVQRSRWMPWLTAGISGVLIAGGALLNVAGRTGAAGSIFQAVHVVTGERNFGDIELPLVWRLCARSGSDVYSDVTCVQQNIATAPEHVMDYGPSWLWFPQIAIPPAWSTFIGLVMLVVTSGSLWWLSRNSLGRGQIALLVGSFGASWLLLLERGNIDALIVWFAVAFAFWLRRSSGIGPWVFAAVAIWLLGTWKYYPFALGLLLLPVIRRHRGWWVLSAFALASAAYVVLAFDRFLQAQADNADRSALIGIGLGRDSIARLLAGSPQPPLWALVLVLLASIATFGWGFAAGSQSRKVSYPYVALALTGSLMVTVPVIVSGFGHQYKVALLVLTIPLLSRLRRSSDSSVWQSSTFALIATAGALVGLWGNPFTWSLLIVAATTLALGAGVAGLVQEFRSRPPSKQPAARRIAHPRDNV